MAHGLGRNFTATLREQDAAIKAIVISINASLGCLQPDDFWAGPTAIGPHCQRHLDVWANPKGCERHLTVP